MSRSSVEAIESSESLWSASESDDEEADDDAEGDADACATLCSRSGVNVRLAGVRRIRLNLASVICALYWKVRNVSLEGTECITMIFDEWSLRVRLWTVEGRRWCRRRG